MFFSKIFNGSEDNSGILGKFICMIIQGRKDWTLDCFMALHMELLGLENRVVNLFMDWITEDKYEITLQVFGTLR